MNEIDVSKCYYYNTDNTPFCCELYDDECEVHNCYFQQLQQLKQENEKLKEQMAQCPDEIEEMTKNLKK